MEGVWYGLKFVTSDKDFDVILRREEKA